jgi:hypothetical protein
MKRMMGQPIGAARVSVFIQSNLPVRQYLRKIQSAVAQSHLAIPFGHHSFPECLYVFVVHWLSMMLAFPQVFVMGKR